MANRDYWTLNLTSASVGNENIKLTSDEIIVDSGTSYILMPTEDFASFIAPFNTTGQCWAEDALAGFTVCSCTYPEFQQYPDLNIEIGNHTYRMDKWNYVELYGNMCLFKVMTMDFSAGWGTRFWILGLNFFHNYYTVFDQEQGRIGFAESKLSNL